MAKGGKQRSIRSITNILYITTQIAALGWVSVSYLIAIFATVRMGQVFPVVELSEQAIESILGVAVLKTIGNIFEHNDGPVFGKSTDKREVKRDC